MNKNPRHRSLVVKIQGIAAQRLESAEEKKWRPKITTMMEDKRGRFDLGAIEELESPFGRADGSGMGREQDGVTKPRRKTREATRKVDSKSQS